MQYHGTVYIFDLDDTLVWSSDWHNNTKVNEEGHVTDPGDSLALRDALRLLEPIGANLRMEESEQLDNQNIYFLVVDASNSPMTMDDLEKIRSLIKHRDEVFDKFISHLEKIVYMVTLVSNAFNGWKLVFLVNYNNMFV